ncbi:MAG: hypothetical protein HFI76_05755 [Lachnospiraceae bacterium]|nr:hypothetical protein [Lachnospiraceae bacterium]
MLFKSKKTLPTLQLYGVSGLLYDGLLKDIPIKEEILLAKSIEFFDDPEPCHIHRSAVRTRLTAEIQKELLGQPGKKKVSPGPLLLSYADVAGIVSCASSLLD